MASGLNDLGRFAEPALLVLVALADGPKHGYAIMTEAERIGGWPLGPGTLYAALGRLERRGLIEPMPQERRRRPYRLTGAGATALEEQLHDLERFARTGLTRLASQR
jgi:DNA-binding PadR family transcriptional regulator